MKSAAFAALLLLFACQTAPPPDFTAADRAAIDEVATRYLTTARAADWDGWTELWTADAVYMNPDAPPLVGKADIRASMDVFPDPPSEMRLTLRDADGSGKWAWGPGLLRLRHGRDRGYARNEDGRELSLGLREASRRFLADRF